MLCEGNSKSFYLFKNLFISSHSFLSREVCIENKLIGRFVPKKGKNLFIVKGSFSSSLLAFNGKESWFALRRNLCDASRQILHENRKLNLCEAVLQIAISKAFSIVPLHFQKTLCHNDLPGRFKGLAKLCNRILHRFALQCRTFVVELCSVGSYEDEICSKQFLKFYAYVFLCLGCRW